ncbi:MAG TPA: anti-sigma factor [Solirubrobacteraceae bacterium]|nr:anti-sigma factor [Solirubrobacteraceae bacterium]
MSEHVNTPGVHDCGGDAAAYVLGALEPEEVAGFLEHLEQCSVCRDEVEALRGVVQALPMAAPQFPAPARLRRRVVRSVRQEQARRPRATSTARPAGTAGTVGWSPARWVAGWSVGQWVGVLAVACTSVLVVVALLTSATRQPSRLISAKVTGATGSAVLRVTGSRGELIVHHLSPPPRGRVYEVWLKAAHRNPVPANVLFVVSRRGDAVVGLPRSLRGMSVMMVTAERAGGSPVPTGKPVIVAQLS